MGSQFYLSTSICSFFIFQGIAGAAIDPVKENQLKTNDEDLKSSVKDCPEGAFHHPITGLCTFCDCVGDYSTLSAENKEYFASNCANLVNKCLRQFQFYDENLSICRNCSDVCGEDNSNKLCKLNCPEDRCCVDTEVYSPHTGFCILCSQICEEERNEAYCIKNCRSYNKSSKQEISTVFTTSLNNQSHHSSSTTKTDITDGNNSNSSTIIIVVVIMTVAVLLIVAILFYLQRRDRLRCTTQQQEHEDNQDNAGVGEVREEIFQMLPRNQQESEIEDAIPDRGENGNEAAAAEERSGETKPVLECGNSGDQVTPHDDSVNSLYYRDLHSHVFQPRGQLDDDAADNDEEEDDDNESRPQSNQSSLLTERKLLDFDHSVSLF